MTDLPWFPGGGSAPTGPAGGDLAGNYPNPTIAPSVALAGNPTAATQAQGNNSTRLATTAYVDTAVAGVSLASAPILAPAASTRNVIQPTDPTVKSLILKGAASQSGNQFEIQSSTGTALAFFTAAGDLTLNKSSNVLTLGSSGATLTGSPNEIDVGNCAFVIGGGVYFNNAAPKWLSAGLVQTTVGAAGGAAALPATPTKYLKVIDNAGTSLVVPAYAAS